MSSRSVSTQTDDVKSKEDGQKRFKDPSQQAGPSSQNKPPALLKKQLKKIKNPRRKKNRSDKVKSDCFHILVELDKPDDEYKEPVVVQRFLNDQGELEIRNRFIIHNLPDPTKRELLLRLGSSDKESDRREFNKVWVKEYGDIVLKGEVKVEYSKEARELFNSKWDKMMEEREEE